MIRACAAVLALLLVLPARPALAAPAGAPGSAPAPLRVVVDAGHGGGDPGAISPGGMVTEKDVTLRMALLTGAALQRRGIGVVYTRTDDRYVALAERAATAGRSGAGLLLSLHLNSAPNSAVSGAEAWYGAGPRDADLAGAVLAGLGPAVRDYGLSLRGTRSGTSLAVLRTAVPAVLVELGYVTNAREATLLTQPAFLERLAEGLAVGVQRFRDGTRVTGSLVSPTGPGTAPLALTDLYFIRPGDTLQSIASRFRTAAEEIVRLNPPAETQRLLPGSPLTVPVGGAVVASWAADGGAATATSAAGARPVRPAGAAVTAPVGETHTVSAGETLGGIALRYGVSTTELATLNGITDARRLLVGQRLRLRAGAGVAAAASTGTQSGSSAGSLRYRVQPGDTLSEIAQRHDVTLAALRAANPSGSADLVVVGTLVTIPRRG